MKDSSIILVNKENRILTLDSILDKVHTQGSRVAAVYDNDYKVVHASSSYVKRVGFAKADQLLGYSPFDLTWGKNVNNHFKLISNYNKIITSKIQPHFSITRFDEEIQINKKILIDNHVYCYADRYKADNKLLSLQHIHMLMQRYGVDVLLPIIDNRYPFNIKLSRTEQLVIFYLLLYYTQIDMANILGCSRSMIAKIISDYLCPKFGIAGYSGVFLREKLISMGYQHFIPMNLPNNVTNRVNNNSASILSNNETNIILPELHNNILKLLDIGLTQKEIAEKVGMSRSFISKIKNKLSRNSGAILLR